MDLGAVTHPGSVRPDNEDGYFATREHGVFAVADGMGGHAHGEVASHLALDAIADRAAALADAAPSELPVALHDAIQAANTQIFAQAEAEDLRDRMGTTLVVATVCDDRLYFAHIGDSRLYLLRGDALSQLTRDHSLVQSMVDRGEITLEEAALHPLRHQITRVVGSEALATPEIASQALQPGDHLLLCTDGLSGVVPTETLRDVLAAAQPAQQKADALITAALEAGAPDNVTAVVVAYQRPRPVAMVAKPAAGLPWWGTLLLTLLALAVLTLGFGFWAYRSPQYFIGVDNRGTLQLFQRWPLLPMFHPRLLRTDAPAITVEEAWPNLLKVGDPRQGIVVKNREAGDYFLRDQADAIAERLLVDAKRAIDARDYQAARTHLARARVLGANPENIKQLTRMMTPPKPAGHGYTERTIHQ